MAPARETVTEQIQDLRPSIRSIDDRAHRVGAGAMSVQQPVLEIDARPVLRQRCEAHLDLARAREIGLVPKLVGDLPREHETGWRLVGDDARPHGLASILVPRVTPTADMLFD